VKLPNPSMKNHQRKNPKPLFNKLSPKRSHPLPLQNHQLAKKLKRLQKSLKKRKKNILLKRNRREENLKGCSTWTLGQKNHLSQ
jgi:hypothetical protein